MANECLSNRCTPNISATEGVAKRGTPKIVTNECVSKRGSPNSVANECVSTRGTPNRSCDQDVPTNPTDSHITVHDKANRCIGATFDFVNQNYAFNLIADTTIYDVIYISIIAPVKGKLAKQKYEPIAANV